MICKKCGKEVSETDKFCENCGNNLTKKTLVEIIKEYKKQIFVLLIVITVVLAGYFGYQYYNSHKKLVNPYSKYFARIGVQYTKKDNNVIITDFIKDSPAYKSSLQKNDIIIKVNNKQVQGLTLEEISNLIQGCAGKKVKLQIKRKDKIYNILITREYTGDYYYVYEINDYIYTKYLKYDNGKYSFWVMQFPDNKTDYEIGDWKYANLLIMIDVQNQKMGLLEANYYDKNDNIIKTYKAEEIKLDDFHPNTAAYSYYKIIKYIDNKSTKREKEQFKGFLE